MPKGKKVCIIGAEGWGSAISTAVCKNVLNGKYDSRVHIYVYDELVRSQYLSNLMNEQHENIKYLPGIRLPKNLIAVNDLLEAAQSADILIFATPHGYVKSYCNILEDYVKPTAYAVSLVKGLEHTIDGELNLYSHTIAERLQIPCYSMMNANSAMEMAQGKLCEMTVGCDNDAHAKELITLFQTENCMVFIMDDVVGVELCNTLKDLVALSAGFIDGLRLGENARVACLHLGLKEMIRFIKNFNPTTKVSTFFESCGIANSVVSSFADKNVTFANNFVTSRKTIQEIEANLLNGRKLLGPIIAEEIYAYLEHKGIQKMYPLFSVIHRICQMEVSPQAIIYTLRHHPDMGNYSIRQLQIDENLMRNTSYAESIFENVADTVPEQMPGSAEKIILGSDDQEKLNSSKEENEGFWKPYDKYFNLPNKSTEVNELLKMYKEATGTMDEGKSGNVGYSVEMGSETDKVKSCPPPKNSSIGTDSPPIRSKKISTDKSKGPKNKEQSKMDKPDKGKPSGSVGLNTPNDEYKALRVTVKGTNPKNNDKVQEISEKPIQNKNEKQQTNEANDSKADSKPKLKKLSDKHPNASSKVSRSPEKQKKQQTEQPHLETPDASDDSKESRYDNEPMIRIQLFEDEPNVLRFLESMRKEESDALAINKRLPPSSNDDLLVLGMGTDKNRSVTNEMGSQINKELILKGLDYWKTLEIENTPHKCQVHYNIMESQEKAIEKDRKGKGTPELTAQGTRYDEHVVNCAQKQSKEEQLDIEIQQNLQRDLSIEPIISNTLSTISTKTGTFQDLSSQHNIWGNAEEPILTLRLSNENQEFSTLGQTPLHTTDPKMVDITQTHQQTLPCELKMQSIANDDNSNDISKWYQSVNERNNYDHTDNTAVKYPHLTRFSFEEDDSFSDPKMVDTKRMHHDTLPGELTMQSNDANDDNINDISKLLQSGNNKDNYYNTDKDADNDPRLTPFNIEEDQEDQIIQESDIDELNQLRFLQKLFKEYDASFEPTALADSDCDSKTIDQIEDNSFENDSAKVPRNDKQYPEYTSFESDSNESAELQYEAVDKSQNRKHFDEDYDYFSVSEPAIELNELQTTHKLLEDHFDGNEFESFDNSYNDESLENRSTSIKNSSEDFSKVLKNDELFSEMEFASFESDSKDAPKVRHEHGDERPRNDSKSPLSNIDEDNRHELLESENNHLEFPQMKGDILDEMINEAIKNFEIEQLKTYPKVKRSNIDDNTNIMSVKEKLGNHPNISRSSDNDKRKIRRRDSKERIRDEGKNVPEIGVDENQNLGTENKLLDMNIKRKPSSERDWLSDDKKLDDTFEDLTQENLKKKVSTLYQNILKNIIKSNEPEKLEEPKQHQDRLPLPNRKQQAKHENKTLKDSPEPLIAPNVLWSKDKMRVKEARINTNSLISKIFVKPKIDSKKRGHQETEPIAEKYDEPAKSESKKRFYYNAKKSLPKRLPLKLKGRKPSRSTELQMDNKSIKFSLSKIISKSQPKEKTVKHLRTNPYIQNQTVLPAHCKNDSVSGRVAKIGNTKQYHPPINPRIRIPHPPFDVRDHEYHTVNFRPPPDLLRNVSLPRRRLVTTCKMARQVGAQGVARLPRPTFKLPQAMMRSSILAVELGIFAALLARYKTK
ncbi:GH13333 [Drosophila grimshawi]|uniref:Glycerol-3-phosphate dehydrogenase [NAD(+)] n=1 Tax=Drosophila grimshawi TaxID=7222 RepID=B4JTY6_DROGR|nr:GH13333 [Drosophila grimshawi]